MAPLKFSFLKSKAKKHFHNPPSPPCPLLSCRALGGQHRVAPLHCPQGHTALHPPTVPNPHWDPLFRVQGLHVGSPQAEAEGVLWPSTPRSGVSQRHGECKRDRAATPNPACVPCSSQPTLGLWFTGTGKQVLLGYKKTLKPGQARRAQSSANEISARALILSPGLRVTANNAIC